VKPEPKKPGVRKTAAKSESARAAGSKGATARKAEPKRPARLAAGPPHMLNIGYGNLVLASRVIAVVSPQSSPMRRLREEASERGKLVDATQGRRTRSILVTDSDHVILSAINPETIAARLDPGDLPSGS
jgi:regulator of extracellular matrix RemA (YlzA/DUF370 family)